MEKNICQLLLSSTTINTICLFFDIAGALLLFKFGLPEVISRSGSIYLILEQKDDNEKNKALVYDRFGKVGLICLILGFILQVISNFI